MKFAKTMLIVSIILFIIAIVSSAVINKQREERNKMPQIEEDRTVELLMDRFYGKEYCDNLRNVFENKDKSAGVKTGKDQTMVVEIDNAVMDEEEEYYTKMTELYGKKEVTIEEKQKIRKELKEFFDDYEEKVSEELHLKIDTILKQKYIEE